MGVKGAIEEHRGGFQVWETGPSDRDLIVYRDGCDGELNHRLAIQERGADLLVTVVFELPARPPAQPDEMMIIDTTPVRYLCRARLERRVRLRRVVDATTSAARPGRTRNDR